MGYRLLDFIALLKHAAMSASYKPALLRAIVRCVQRGKIAAGKITLEALADEYLEMYWVQAVVFRLRHSPRTSAEPEIIQHIKRASAEALVRDLGKVPSATRHELIDRIAHVLPINVLTAFHRSKPKMMPCFYDWTPGAKSIVLAPEAVAFAEKEAEVLKLIANYFWARFLGKLNYAPRIIDKLELGAAKRKSLAPALQLLTQMGERACFYCGRPFGTELPPTVDHFIPWTFVFEDKIWNLVLACADCNGAKSDQLPSDLLLDKLIRINRLRAAQAGPKAASFLVAGIDPDRQLRELYQAARASEWPGFWAPQT